MYGEHGKPSSDFSMTFPRRYFFCESFLFCYLLFIFIFAILSCLVMTCWERANCLTLLCGVFSNAFVTFPYGIPGQVWNLIVSIPNLSLLLYFSNSWKRSISITNSYISVISTVYPNHKCSTAPRHSCSCQLKKSLFKLYIRAIT